MTLMCLLWCDAIKGLLHLFPAVGELIAKRCPHLKDAVREPELEDRGGDCRIRALVAEINVLPRLRAAFLVFHHSECLGVLSRIRHRALGADDPDKPRIDFARSN